MSNQQQQLEQDEKKRLVVELPSITDKQLTAILRKTGTTKTQLVIMLVQKEYLSLGIADAEAA